LLGCALALAANAQPPGVIAHRGASGYLPEHTLPAYALAHSQGAAWIEPDLVMTRDAVLIALHDVTLESTTDVAARYPSRARNDGHFYAIDFDWSEIATLRVHERVPGRFPQSATLPGVPRFDDVLDLVLGLNVSTGCDVGLYPEIKASAFHHMAGLDPERALLDGLKRHGIDASSTLLRIQSFDIESLMLLRSYGANREHLVQLIAAIPEQPPPQIDLRGIANVARTIGPEKSLLMLDPALVTRAHEAGLEVVTWTFRKDQIGIGFVSFDAELDWAARIGVDALFTDHPDRAVAHFGQTRRCGS
jgi:glycerophosphoryl diester phosphodiesterase